LTTVRDTQCGFKLFKGDAARRLLSLSRLDGYCFDVEVLMLARDEGFKVAEVPIRWNDSGRSQVRPLLDAGLMLMDLLALRSGVRL
jgi:dolichyl-phosphate beta-glucosyltransferase